MRGRSDLVTALLARVARLHMMTILSHICVSFVLLISCVCVCVNFLLFQWHVFVGLGDPRTPLSRIYFFD